MLIQLEPEDVRKLKESWKKKAIQEIEELPGPFYGGDTYTITMDLKTLVSASWEDK